MRILIWTSSYSPVLGGLQTLTSQLVNGLLANGHEIIVLTNRYPVFLKGFEKIDGCSVHRIIHANPNMSGLKGLVHKLFYYQSRRSINRIIKSFKPEIINVHFPDVQIPFLKSLQFTNCKIVTSFHGHDILRYFEEGDDYFYDKVCSSLDRQKNFVDLKMFLSIHPIVTSCSGWLRSMVTRIFPEVNPHVIYNAVGIKHKPSSEVTRNTEPFILAFGRFEKCKGFGYLISEYANAHELSQGKLLPLILHGEGTEIDKLRSLIDLYNMHEKIHLKPRLPHDQMLEIIGKSSLVIIPSLREPFGIVALESLAFGRDVWCSDRGGMPEAGGDCVEYFKPEKGVLQKKLMFFLQIGSRWNNEIQFGRKSHLDNFTIPRLVSNYEALFFPNKI
jgi:glycosyltransferase involved in cell wall biosynthesis